MLQYDPPTGLFKFTNGTGQVYASPNPMLTITHFVASFPATEREEALRTAGSYAYAWAACIDVHLSMAAATIVDPHTSAVFSDVVRGLCGDAPDTAVTAVTHGCPTQPNAAAVMFSNTGVVCGVPPNPVLASMICPHTGKLTTAGKAALQSMSSTESEAMRQWFATTGRSLPGFVNCACGENTLAGNACHTAVRSAFNAMNEDITQELNNNVNRKTYKRQLIAIGIIVAGVVLFTVALLLYRTWSRPTTITTVPSTVTCMSTTGNIGMGPLQTPFPSAPITPTDNTLNTLNTLNTSNTTNTSSSLAALRRHLGLF